MGPAATHTPPPDNSGTFKSNYGLFHMLQNGVTVAGCYEHDEGLIENRGFDGRAALHLAPGEGRPLLERSGHPDLPADGKSFRGFWSYVGNKRFDGVWNGKRVSRKVGTCPNWKPGGNAVEEQLASQGHVRLYGILFDTHSLT